MEKIFTAGVLLVDKPTGVTSHQVVNWARKMSGIKKVGHTGTLDPLATGLLILLIGREYTKQQAKYLKQDKSYICTARLGLETDSYDLDGQVVSRATWQSISSVTANDLTQVLSKFKGELEQKVPVFSAVKRGGKKLYQLAREAKDDHKAKLEYQALVSNLPSRKIKIDALNLTEFRLDHKKQELLFSFEVSCSSGTYIRSLAHDIGKELGLGATVVKLRRTKIGNLSVDRAKVCPLLLRRSFKFSKNKSVDT